MNESSTTRSVTATEIYAHRLVVVALIASLATFLIAAAYPSGKAADVSSSLSFGAVHGWLAAQSFALTIPGLVLGLLVGRLLPRIGAWLGAAVMFAVPVIELCDVMTFTWIAERFLSDATVRISTTLLPAIMIHVSRTQILQAVCLIALICVSIIVTWIVAGSIGRRWHAREHSVKPWVASIVFAGVVMLMSIPALSNRNRTLAEMATSSARHPFCAFHLVGYRGTGIGIPRGGQAIHARLRGLRAAPAVFQRDALQREIRMVSEDVVPKSGQRKRPDVILVVIESFRPEMIAHETMPHLAEFANKSILCRNHFSGGNATFYGMFSILTGLEAIWFHRPTGSEPVFNRLLHQAGYKIAFYGGHNSWVEFGLATYVCPEVFDDFHIQPPDLPKSDTDSVEMSLRFIDREGAGSRVANWEDGDSEESRDAPRAVITYMFGTHLCEMYSDPSDRIFQPATRDNLVVSQSPEKKAQVFNGYKNSFQTMDRMIAPLLRDDCVVIVLGDHGESFMDDGTHIHGTRLSRFQNMTPAVIGYPGVKPRVIDSPTMHADLLPTLLSILDISFTPSNAFDGIDLVTAEDETIADRLFVSCHVVTRTSMLIGPWSFQAGQPFAHRFLFDIDRWQANYLNPIDQRGLELDASAVNHGKEPYKQWVIDRFGADSYTDATEQQLFSELFRCDDPRVRSNVLRIAREVADPEPYLYDLIVEATADADPDVRARAKKLVIELNRAPKDGSQQVAGQ